MTRVSTVGVHTMPVPLVGDRRSAESSNPFKERSYLISSHWTSSSPTSFRPNRSCAATGRSRSRGELGRFTAHDPVSRGCDQPRRTRFGRGGVIGGGIGRDEMSDIRTLLLATRRRASTTSGILESRRGADGFSGWRWCRWSIIAHQSSSLSTIVRATDHRRVVPAQTTPRHTTPRNSAQPSVRSFVLCRLRSRPPRFYLFIESGRSCARCITIATPSRRIAGFLPRRVTYSIPPPSREGFSYGGPALLFGPDILRL